MADAVLGNEALLTDRLITAVGKGNGLWLATAVEHNVDGLPRIAASMIVQAESYDTLWHFEEFEMATNQVGVAQTESGMSLTEGNESFVVLEDLREPRQVIPVEVVDAVGRLERVVDALLVA